MRRFVPPVPTRVYFVRLLSAVAVACGLALTTISAQIPGRNVNMVSGTDWPLGDPFLQRQNEPSIAASTRNPLHLLGGSNDYRTVDVPGLSGDEVGDAWLGLYKSFDGGQRWISTLLPGYPQDASPDGLTSPIHGYGAGADAVVRAGTNGLIYYAGLVFDRSNPATPTIPGKSAIFVSRFIDNNNKEAGDTFQYLGTRALQTDPGGATGNFLDKPWLTVDIPRDSARCTIVTPADKGPITQSVPAGPLYVAYTLKSKDSSGDRYDVMFTRSGDCGNSWSTPVKINNQSDRANQGAVIAVDPKSGDVYVAWRRFDLNGDNDAIMTTKFNLPTKKFDPPGLARRYPKGRKKGLDPAKFFTKGGVNSAIAAAQLSPFDQGTSPISELLAFRTNAYPSMTIDDGGRVYLAWSERGADPLQPDPVFGEARVMIATSSNGKKWTDAQPVALEGQLGHQIMPTITFSGAKLMLVYYDLRETRAEIFSQYIDDKTGGPNRKRHTIDLRASMASPAAAPDFAPSVRVSDYLEGPRTQGGPNVPLQVNPPNLPMFMQGTAPFIGDYIDVTAAPNFVIDAKGKWVYNTAASATPPIFHAVWTDNRDVRPPRFDTNGDGNPWNDYAPPGTFGGGTSLADPTRQVPMCVAGNAGSRNQNIYTARITGGLLVGSPGNTKSLSPDFQRAFVVFAQNTTEVQKVFRLTIVGQPPGGRASFTQFPLPPYTAASPPPLTVIEAVVPKRSTISRTVYATSSDPQARITINVTEIGSLNGATVTGGLGSAIVLNPDIDNPDIDNPDIDNPDIDNPDIDNAEVYNPDIDNPDIDNPDIDNPDIDNPDIDNPDIDNVELANPDIDNPDIDNPDIDNPDIDNPDIDNPDIDNPDIDNSSLMTDVSWSLTNRGNTTAAYNVNLFFAQANFKPTVKTQLILHRVYKTPIALNCDLKSETRNIVVANVPNPQLIKPGMGQVSDPNDPEATNATIFLAPGESAKITFRIFDPDPDPNEIVVVANGNGGTAKIISSFVPNEDVTPVVQQQSVNSEEAEAGVTEPPITPQFPSPEAVNDLVSTTYRTPVTVNVLANDSVAFGSTRIQSVHPAGLGQNMGGGAGELVYLPGTRLLYAGSGRTVGVIDPDSQQLVGRISPPATWLAGAGHGLGNTRANIVYFRNSGNAATNSLLHAVDARPGSATYHQFLAMPALSGAVQTFAIDEIHQRLFVAHGNPVAPAQTMVSAIDINPSSESFHQVLPGYPAALPAGTRASMLAVNRQTGRVWLALTAGGNANGTYYMDADESPSVVKVTGVSGFAAASIVVNEAQNLVFAALNGPQIPGPIPQSELRIQVINGATGTLMFESAPAAIVPLRFGTAEDRMGLHRPTGKVYVRSLDHVVILDGNRNSPTFGATTVIPVGHEEGSTDLIVDEVTNVVATGNGSSLYTTLIDVHTNNTFTIANNKASSEFALDPVGHRLFQSTGPTVEIYGVPWFNGPALHGRVSVFPEVTELLVNPVTNKTYVATTVFGATMNISSGAGFAGPIAGQPHQAGRYTFGARHNASNMFFVGNSESNPAGLEGKPGSVLVIDGATDTAAGLFASVNNPFGAGVNQNTGQLYMSGLSSSTSDGQIGVHDISNLAAGVVIANTSAIPPIVVNNNPQRLGYGRYVVVNHATNRVYFAVQNGSLTALAYAEPTGLGVQPVVQPIDVAALLPAPYGDDETADFRVDVLLAHAGLNRIYLGMVEPTDQTYVVLILDGTSHQLLGWFGGGGHSRLHTASWLALNEATNALYVVNFNADNVIKLNAAGNGQLTAQATASLPDGPSATAINVSANRLYVSSVTAKSITALKGDTLEVLSSVKLPLMALFMEVDDVESRIYTSGGNTPDESGTMVVTDVLGQLGSNVSVTQASNGARGTTTVNADYSVTYTPNPELSCQSAEGCTDSFTYTVSNQGGTAQGAVTVFIVPAVSRPIAVNDNYVATRNQQLIVGAPGLLANDIGGLGDVVIDVLAGDVNGTLVAANDGSFTYTPNEGFTGQDTFSYSVTVNGVTSNTATIFINVNAPIAFVVTNTNDSGVGSLRQAIQLANADAAVSPVIRFNIPGEGVRVISPLTSLPSLQVPMTIDGYTQPGSEANASAAGTTATIQIELRGNLIGGFANGLTVTGSGVTIRGLAIGSFSGSGIQLDGAGGNTIEGSFIGVTALGASAPNNSGGVMARSPNNMIGSANHAGRNWISGNNQAGVRVTAQTANGQVLNQATGTVVINNLIGTNASGLTALANTGDGVQVSVPNVRIGGTSALERNIISGNTSRGVNSFANVFSNTVLTGPNALLIQGNYIGVGAAGGALPNIGVGVNVNGVTNIGGTAGTTPGACTGACNVIAGNTQGGIGLFAQFDNPSQPNETMGTLYSSAAGSSVRGNFIGLNAAGTAVPNGPVPPAFSSGIQVNVEGVVIGGAEPGAGNVISGNNGVGINLGFSNLQLNGNIVTTAAGAVIKGNFIGVTRDGQSALGNLNNGIAVSTPNVTIGGPNPGDRNIISGNGQGNTGAGVNAFGGTYDPDGPGPLVRAQTNPPTRPTGLQVINNYVGTDIDGTAAIPNLGPGLSLSAPQAVVRNNLISGNTGSGLSFGAHFDGVTGEMYASADGAVAEGNLIGVDVTGNALLANTGNGIGISAPNVRLGGNTVLQRNVIGGNRGVGVSIGSTFKTNNEMVTSGIGARVQGNYIGVGADGATLMTNLFSAVNSSAANVTIGGGLDEGNVIVSAPNASAVNLARQLAQSGALINAGGSSTVRGNIIGLNANQSQRMNGGFGVSVSSADNTIVNNVIAGNGVAPAFVAGISLNTNGNNNVIRANIIGTNPSGDAGLGNAGSGISVGGGMNNIIGGPQPADRNVISGNMRDGVSLNAQPGQTTTGNRVIGNYIGVNFDGATALPNAQNGVQMFSNAGSSLASNFIGGANAGEGNVISGNTGGGISLGGINTANNHIVGNLIGTIASGLGALPNSSNGIFINDAVDNLIGGDAAAGNLIAFNTHNGIAVQAAGARNKIIGNRIHSNTQLGIDLNWDGRTLNDQGDADSGANNLQNFPVLSNASNSHGPSTRVDVSLTSFANGIYDVQFFANSGCDPSGHGEGQRLIASYTGHAAPATSQLFMNEAVPAGQFITALATDAQGNTSEFSACVEVDPSTTVTNAGDSGPGSLRAAIQAANASPGQQAIKFSIPGAGPGSPALIQLASPLPTLNETVIIDGTTQPGYDGLPVIEVRSPSDTAGWTGFYLNASNITIRGLSIFRFGEAILGFQGFTGHLIENNIIGTNRTLVEGIGNTRGIQWRANNGTIRNNVISGNQEGLVVLLGASATLIQSNLIGVGHNGITPLKNYGNGVTMFDGAQQTVLTGNTIAHNGGWGVDLQFSGAQVSNTTFQLNVIGLDANGNDAGNFLGGIRLDRAPGTQIGSPGFRNIISGNGGDQPQEIGVGIHVLGVVNPRPQIQSNFIGLDNTGVFARSNNNKGIVLDGNAKVGGNSANEGNYISGNGDASGGAGIFAGINATSSEIAGNVIGLNVSNAAVGNGYSGITVTTPGAIRIGGDGGQGNVISGNGLYGISVLKAGIEAPLPFGTTIENNKIGTDAGGSLARGNGSAGISIEGTLHRIGGFGGTGNVIANNGAGGGIRVIGNSSQVEITLNAIRDNGGLGIDLAGNGVTLNDGGDGDVGPNGFQNYAPITDAFDNDVHTIVEINTNELAAGNYTVQFFSAPSCDGSGFGEGDTPLMWFAGVAGGSGLRSFNLQQRVPNGHVVTATITNGANQTSEFSPCRVVGESLAADRLAFVVQPSSSTAGAAIAPPIQVAIQNAAGNTVATATDAVTLGIRVNPGGGGLVGTVTRNAVNGIATFNDLYIDRAGNGYVLSANSGSLTEATSQPFNIQPSVFTVTTTADSGPGSLRQAILDANSRIAIPSTIRFNFGGPAPHTITPASPLPIATGSITIDGTPGGVCTVDPPSVEIDGVAAGGVMGLQVNGTATIRGLSITRFGVAGIRLASNSNLLQCNWIGIGPGGTAKGNHDGVLVQGSNNTIGGTIPSDRNIISGNSQRGVVLTGGSLNTVQGNYVGTNPAGSSAVPNGTGISNNSNSSRIRDNVVSGNTGSGIEIGGGTSGTIVVANLVGTDAAGAAAIPNQYGISIGNAHGTTIGGTQPADRNMIAGNVQHGVVLTSQDAQNVTNNRVIGNYIGVRADGVTALPNGAYGVRLFANVNSNITGNTIGGSNPGEGNLISGNGLSGVALQGSGTTGNTILGNLIGTTAGGAGALPNATHGVFITAASDNTIGGIGPTDGNLIAFNPQNGIITDSASVRNRILGNRIHSNTMLGIDLNGNGVTANDNGDDDAGGNNLQNFPVLSNATNTEGGTRVDVNLTSFASGSYTLQFFANPSCDPSGNGEGQRLIGHFTDHAAPATTQLFMTEAVPAGQLITALATDANGNTSEFSPCAEVDPFIALTPNPFAVVTNTSAPMTVTLSHPAGVGGQTVNFASNDPAAAVQPSILIAEGAFGGTATITTGSTAGSAIITATAAGFQDGTANVNVSLRTMTLSSPSSLVGVGRSLTGTITLAQAAPAGGLAVNLASGNSNFVTVSPAIVTIAQGGTTGTFTINGIAAGASTITASATGASNATLTITATTSSLISMGNPPVVAPGQTAGVAVSLGIDAPAGGVTISFVSSDTNVVTITPSVFVPAGQRTPAANPQITGVVPGTAFVTASAEGFAPDTRTVNVTLTLSFTPANGFAVIAGRTSNITLNLSSPAPAGGLTLNTSIANTAFATVPATVFVTAGTTSVQVPVTGVAVGTTTVRASGTGIAQVSAPVTVNPTPPITINDTTIGKDLQVSMFGSIGLAAPAGGLVVTITSRDPAKALLATSATGAGQASITRTVNAGSTSIGSFWIQALDGTGTATIEATAEGYAPDTSTVTLQPSGFILNMSNFTTNTLAANTSLRIDAARLHPTTLAYQQTQDVRGGLSGPSSVNVVVSSSNTNVGTIVGSPAVFNAGESISSATAFNPAATGGSTISIATPAGFSTPSNFQSITATVTAPAITIGNANVGRDLQMSRSITLAAAPPSPMTVTVTSNNPAVATISKDPAAEGSGSVTFTNVNSTTVGTIYVQGRGLGTTTVRVQAPDYGDGISDVTVDPSGFILNVSNFTTNSFAANTTLRVDASRLHPTTLAYQQTQELRGGLSGPSSVNVAVSSSNTAAGTIVGSPAVFTAGKLLDTETAFDPAGAGITTISLTTPAGFSTPSNFQSITATVTAPAITIGDATVGRDLQMSRFISLAATPPSPRTVTVTSNNPAVATISKDPAAEGTASVTFTNVSSTSVGSIYVQGLGLGTTTLTVQATGYNDGTSNVEVHPSGFILNMSNFSTNTFAGDTTIRVDASRLHPTTLAYQQTQELRAGATAVDVTVTSSDTNVGSIIGSPVRFVARDLLSSASSFHPRTAGTTTISLATPTGFSTPSNFQSITASVSAPSITIGDAIVGRDLQMTRFISLGAVPPNPVTVTVTSNNGTITTITKDGAVAGGTSVTFTNVTSTNVGQIYVQGRGLGSTTLTVQAAGYNDGTSNVRVDPSGFILNISSFVTNTFAANTSLRIDASRLDPTTLNYAQTQEIRGGLSGQSSVSVAVSNSNPSVGPVLNSPAVFSAGQLLDTTTAFDPQALGSTTISLTTPSGFSTPSNFQSITATVNAPAITIGDASVGRDLQLTRTITLQDAPPSPVTVTVTSSDGAIATITKDGTVAGGTTLTFTNVTTTTVGSIFVQGRTLGNTTVTAVAPGYAGGTSSVTVDPSGFILNVSNFTTTVGAANISLRLDASRLTPGTLLYTGTQELRGGMGTVNVEISSSNTAVGTIVGSPVAFVPRDLLKTTAAFDPAAVGTTTIAVSTPAGFSTPSNLQSITATVNP